MAVATASRMASTGILHIFDRVDNVHTVKCELCGQEEAFFQWSKQLDDRFLRQAVPVCRTCASMIVLLGKER